MAKFACNLFSFIGIEQNQENRCVPGPGCEVRAGFSGLRRLEIFMIQPFKTSVRRMRIIMCKRARGNLPARDESPVVRDKSAALVRTNPELPCPTESEAGCRSFHPATRTCRRGPRPSTPATKTCRRGCRLWSRRLERFSFEVQLLWIRYKSREVAWGSFNAPCRTALCFPKTQSPSAEADGLCRGTPRRSGAIRGIQSYYRCPPPPWPPPPPWNPPPPPKLPRAPPPLNPPRAPPPE